MQKLEEKFKKVLLSKHVSEWNNFETFKDWSLKNGYMEVRRMRPGYYCALHLKNTDQPFGPDNCEYRQHFHIKRWMQSVPFEYNNKKQSLYDWCTQLKKDYNQVFMKIEKERKSYATALGFVQDEKELTKFKSLTW